MTTHRNRLFDPVETTLVSWNSEFGARNATSERFLAMTFPRSRGSPMVQQPRVGQSRRSEAAVIAVRELLSAS
ncbi:hypothetical protein Taro_030600 [Colocasia esculenta]|uniref:Uncharacterized protein n=1 Tax=Colocasia esculenta TaxID=4460 RepID=A0A843VGQ0_COLES|nr:hypothetical protein [Colocasia esculenta]